MINVFTILIVAHIDGFEFNTFVFSFIALATLAGQVQSTKESSRPNRVPILLSNRLVPPYTSSPRMTWSPALNIPNNAVVAPNPDAKQSPYLAPSIAARQVSKVFLVGFPDLLYSYCCNKHFSSDTNLYVFILILFFF